MSEQLVEAFELVLSRAAIQKGYQCKCMAHGRVGPIHAVDFNISLHDGRQPNLLVKLDLNEETVTARVWSKHGEPLVHEVRSLSDPDLTQWIEAMVRRLDVACRVIP